DGFISAVSALLALRICPKVHDFMIASHVSKEPAGHMLLDELGLSPVITADMSCGEGTGAVALFPLLDMVTDVYRNLAHWDNWNGDETYEILK
ncbi:MAG: nicotinate-nucleotide--dimethylbenzimidazole phosphoribosyltransferase, partial [Lachnospiraceae bacterium]|nr:nicotinate-nucleotide--dimethylbenzimidazole phosphoribosyltransferase [Lachnospiraceae bacterium]